MTTLANHGVFLTEQWDVIAEGSERAIPDGRTRTMAWQILNAHNQSEDMENLKLTFDSLVSPDNNYVSILQTARASGLTEFPVPYVLSNCHHTLCAVGGTINEDDHVFGLGNAEKYGGIFVPPYRAVLHQYMREMMAGGGRMILGSDSHTRYGALGTMGIGEGGGEVVKQLLKRTYDIKRPPVIAVRLTGVPKPGVGPQDVALELIAATFANGFCKNKILEFVGPGIASLSVEYRMGIDVMTTESAALSSIWCTDDKVKEYLAMHGREEAYSQLRPGNCAYYDGMIEINLSQVECMIALPYHPSRAVSIRQFKAEMPKLLMEVEAEGRKIKGEKGKAFSIMEHMRDGEFYVDQALISGCGGGLFENIVAMADILKDYGIPGNGPALGINPASLPVMSDLMKQGVAGELAVAGATMRPAICGPCFGVTDVPADNQISIRHTTRNYPNREGSKPGQGQMAAVCLMDARSIAATIRNGGKLTAATDLDVTYREMQYHFEKAIYENQVFDNFGKPDTGKELVMGSDIADWPVMYPLTTHLLLKTAGVYQGSVTTDELIPSGEASSFRSNPERISEYTMISRDKDYVSRAKAIRALDVKRRQSGEVAADEAVQQMIKKICAEEGCAVADITIGSLMSSEQIGDGSSREQAASCQKVLGGFANLANEYATKRYRSNLINWGILPFLSNDAFQLDVDDIVVARNIFAAVQSGQEKIALEVYRSGKLNPEFVLEVTLGELTSDEKNILSAGCLINYYQQQAEMTSSDAGNDRPS